MKLCLVSAVSALNAVAQERSTHPHFLDSHNQLGLSPDRIKSDADVEDDEDVTFDDPLVPQVESSEKDRDYLEDSLDDVFKGVYDLSDCKATCDQILGALGSGSTVKAPQVCQKKCEECRNESTTEAQQSCIKSAMGMDPKNEDEEDDEFEYDG